MFQYGYIRQMFLHIDQQRTSLRLLELLILMI